MAVPSRADGPDPAAEPNPFEFFSPRSPPAICAADDVFLAGKILPFGAPPPKRAESPGGLRWQETSAVSDDLRLFWGGGGKAGYRRLRRVLDCDGKALPPPPPPVAAKQQRRPRWYLCVLGPVRVPATMDMGDIRSRQRRQSAAAEASGGDVGRGTWRLLRSLSCRGLESVSAVTSPLTFVAHVQGA